MKDKKYAEITQSLAVRLSSKPGLYVASMQANISVQAVKQISASFKPYTSVPRIAQLWKRIQEVQGEIRTMLEADFDT